MEEKAQKFLREGYARLASFEVEGGGFSCFGEPPARLWFSAYGLRQLNEMKDVTAVDQKLLERTKLFVQTHLEGYTGAARIFAELALFEVAGLDKIEESAPHLPPERTDMYEEAIELNLLALKYPRNQEVQSRVARLAVRFLHGNLPPAINTLTGAYGHYGNTELLGWLSSALVLSGGEATLRRQIVDKLIAAKSPYGGWGTTHATVLALRALMLDSQAAPTSGKLTVTSEDGAAAYEMSPTDTPIVSILPTDKMITLHFAGTGRVAYSLLTKAYQRWGKEEDSLMRDGLNLQMTLSKQRVSLMEPFHLRFVCTNTLKQDAGMTVLSIGLCAGLLPSVPHLAELHRAKKISRYEIETGKVVLYLDGFPALGKMVFTLPVSGSRPGKYILPATMLYEYYSPDNLSIVPQETLEIVAKEDSHE